MFKFGKKKSIELDKDNIPQHIAFIMDGNGRWANKRGLPRTAGHKAGMDNLKRLVNHCHALGVKYVTVYAFSTENWRRPQDEVDYLMKLIGEGFNLYIDELRAQGVKVQIIGDFEGVPGEVKEAILKGTEQTRDNQGLILTFAFNYGGRQEIVQAVKKIVEKVSGKELNLDELDEKTFSHFLYCPDLPDPDLVVRTSGEMRISNFLLWQIAYAEIYITDVFWPDFDKEELYKAISSYQIRNRKFGGLK